MLANAGVTFVAGEPRPASRPREGRHADRRDRDGERRKFGAKVFLDATYEGDLMARAGVSYIVGREPNSQYGEELNGIQLNRVIDGVDPYVVPGDPGSGTLPGVVFGRPPGEHGQGDGLTQSYNFRLTLTDVKENQLAIERPDDYDPRLYEAARRQLAVTRPATIDKVLLRLTPMPNHKTDTNNSGLFSTDFLGMSFEWPEAGYAARARIWQAHKSYTLGLLWFLGHDPRVPQPVRDEMLRAGLARDEFTATGHWPPQLYVPSAADGERLRRHRSRRPSPAQGRGPGGPGHLCDGLALRVALRRRAGQALARGGIRHVAQGASDARQLSLDRPAPGRGVEPARAGLPLGVARRLRVDSHGARVHDAGPVGGDGRLPGDRRRRGPSGPPLPRSPQAPAGRWAGPRLRGHQETLCCELLSGLCVYR